MKTPAPFCTLCTLLTLTHTMYTVRIISFLCYFKAIWEKLQISIPNCNGGLFNFLRYERFACMAYPRCGLTNVLKWCTEISFIWQVNKISRKYPVFMVGWEGEWSVHNYVKALDLFTFFGQDENLEKEHMYASSVKSFKTILDAHWQSLFPGVPV